MGCLATDDILIRQKQLPPWYDWLCGALAAALVIGIVAFELFRDLGAGQ